MRLNQIWMDALAQSIKTEMRARVWRRVAFLSFAAFFGLEVLFVMGLKLGWSYTSVLTSGFIGLMLLSTIYFWLAYKASKLANRQYQWFQQYLITNAVGYAREHKDDLNQLLNEVIL